jgi:hypothetical protein
MGLCWAISSVSAEVDVTTTGSVDASYGTLLSALRSNQDFWRRDMGMRPVIIAGWMPICSQGAAAKRPRSGHGTDWINAG